MSINGLSNRIILSSTSQLVELALHRCKTFESLNLFTRTISLPDDDDDGPNDNNDAASVSSTPPPLLPHLAIERRPHHHHHHHPNDSDPLLLLRGIPVSVKDNFCTTGFLPATTCGSRMLTDFFPPYDATVVSRLRARGAVVVGKNNMDEFAMGSGSTDGCFGPAKNPWSFRRELTANGGRGVDRATMERVVEEKNNRNGGGGGSWRVCGGSSGGGAGAVAAGLAMAAIGSDTGGSTRVPASHCGVVGLKPTYGRVSRHGLVPLVNSLDVPGILTRTVDDAALILNILTGVDDRLDSTSVLPDDVEEVVVEDRPSLEGVTVGIPREYFHPSLHPEVADVWRRMTEALRNGGARVVSVSLPHTRFSIVTYSVLCCCEVASNMARFDGLRFGHRDATMDSTEAMYARSRSFGFNDAVRGRILAGNYFLSRQNYRRYFVKAQQVRRLINEELFAALTPGRVDVLLTPTTPAPPMTFRDFSASSNRERTVTDDVFTVATNLAGLPAVSVPVALSSPDPEEGEEGEEMPIGLQVIGQPYGEGTILKVAKWMENHAHFPHLTDVFSLERNIAEC